MRTSHPPTKQNFIFMKLHKSTLWVPLLPSLKSRRKSFLEPCFETERKFHKKSAKKKGFLIFKEKTTSHVKIRSNICITILLGSFIF